MIKFANYSPQDLERIDLQPFQESWRQELLTPGYAQSLDVPGRCWTALDGERVVGSAGFSPQWEGRSIAWAILGKDIPPRQWPRIKKKIRAEVDKELQKQVAACGHGRVEITVPVSFAAGCRLALLLGFEVEGRTKKFAPDGSDHFLFSKVA